MKTVLVRYMSKYICLVIYVVFLGTRKGTCSIVGPILFCFERVCVLHALSLSLRSRGSTLRSKSRPLGRPDSLKVQEGNVMTARVMVLCVLAAATASWWVVEQPSSSIMEYHPTFQKTLALLRGVRKLSICMANYGGESRKGTYLYSSIFACNEKPFPYFLFANYGWLNPMSCKSFSFQSQSF